MEWESTQRGISKQSCYGPVDLVENDKMRAL